MPRAVLSAPRQLRAVAQIQAAAQRDVIGQVQVTNTLANAINNSVTGTIIGNLQDVLNSKADAIFP